MCHQRPPFQAATANLASAQAEHSASSGRLLYLRVIRMEGSFVLIVITQFPALALRLDYRPSGSDPVQSIF